MALVPARCVPPHVGPLGAVRRRCALACSQPTPLHHRAPAHTPQVVVHVTPLRCSRAMALRHLALRFKRPLDTAFTLVAFTAPQVGGRG